LLDDKELIVDKVVLINKDPYIIGGDRHIHNIPRQTSGVQLPEHDRDQFRRAAFAQQLKNRVTLTLVKVTGLRITLNLDGTYLNHTLTHHTLKLLVC
jgi:hypothetical protein